MLFCEWNFNKIYEQKTYFNPLLSPFFCKETHHSYIDFPLKACKDLFSRYNLLFLDWSGSLFSFTFPSFLKVCWIRWKLKIVTFVSTLCFHWLSICLAWKLSAVSICLQPEIRNKYHLAFFYDAQWVASFLSHLAWFIIKIRDQNTWSTIVSFRTQTYSLF